MRLRHLPRTDSPSFGTCPRPSCTALCTTCKGGIGGSTDMRDLFALRVEEHRADQAVPHSRLIPPKNVCRPLRG